MKNYAKFIVTFLIAGAALLLEFVFHYPYAAQLLITVIGGIVAISMLIGMIKVLKSGKYGVDLLAITAIAATLAVGEYWASLMILIMLTGGDSLEDFASRKANSDLRSLLEHSPEIAHLQNGEGLEDIDVNDVVEGNYLVVKPYELIPVDGRVISGISSVDQSSLTGESQLIEKKAGDELMSGSINGDEALVMIAEKKAEDSQYQKIINLVKYAEQSPAKFVRLADRYAVPFTIISYLIAGTAWFISKDPRRFAEVLVVASPCPLILAAPVAFVSGMSASSRNGIIIKSGTALEKLAKARTIAFDKTGTITEGKIQVDALHPAGDLSSAELLFYAASAEQHSDHILAGALCDYARKIDLAPVDNTREVTSMGIIAQVNNREVKVGKAEFVKNTKTDINSDQTAVFVSVAGKYAGYITFNDRIRNNAAKTISDLRETGLSHVMMLTGDRKDIADRIAAEVNIDDVFADCLPADKITHLKAVPDRMHPVIMVGDGINDAPALAAADVGIAMGAKGATSASESADVVIVKDDLSMVARVTHISKRTMKVAKQSVLTGIIICIILMLIASTGVIPALLGAILQECVDTVSILSSLRALKEK